MSIDYNYVPEEHYYRCEHCNGLIYDENTVWAVIDREGMMRPFHVGCTPEQDKEND